MEKFKIKDGMLVSYHGDDEVLVIPEGVTSIHLGAFLECHKFTKVIFPSTIKDLDAEAFDYCKDIREIEVSPENKQYYVFQNCLIEPRTKKLVFGAKRSIIPKDGSVLRIGCHAFGGTSCCTIFIPKCIEYVGQEAFFLNENCYINLEEDEVPSSWDEDWCPSGDTEDSIWWEAGDPDILIHFGCKDD